MANRSAIGVRLKATSCTASAEDGSDDGGKHAAPQQLIDPGTDFLLDDWAGIYPNPSSDSDSNEEIEDP